MAQDDEPDLLDRLKATVTDGAVFPIEGAGFVDKAGFRRNCAQVFDDLDSLATAAWNRAHDPYSDEPDIAAMARALFELHGGLLTTCWKSSVEDAIRQVAEAPDLLEPHDRIYLYFMLGLLAAFGSMRCADVPAGAFLCANPVRSQ